ncbi:MAG TPA: CvpA family protein, partial [Pyrinomonadaceae bacterium]|nr:CvpA family protein [Pyrinomonadaceae bacterium]
MTFFDLFVLAIIGSSVVAGALRGLVRALIAGAALVVGLVVAARAYEQAGALLAGLGLVESKAAAHAGGFLLIVGVALTLGFVLGALVKSRVGRTRLRWFDRALGGAFGFVRGLAVCSAIYLALTAFPVRLGTVETARTAPALAE